MRRERSLGRALAAEGIGTAMLLAAVVGSGIMGERLAGGNVAIALLANTIATGAALVALILTFGSVSVRTSTPLCPSLMPRRADWVGAMPAHMCWCSVLAVSSGSVSQTPCLVNPSSLGLLTCAVAGPSC
jgi:hypothetical protein